MAHEIPQVVKDPNLSDLVSKFQVRPEIIGKCMLDGGVESDQVSDYKIHFSAESGGEKINGEPIYGEFDYRNLTSTVFLGSFYLAYQFALKAWLEKTNTWPPSPAVLKAINPMNQREVNEALFHETKHGIDFAVMGSEAYLAEKDQHIKISNRGPRTVRNTLAAVSGISAIGGGWEFVTTNKMIESDPKFLWLSGIAVGSLMLDTAVRSIFDRDKRKYETYKGIPGEVRAFEYAAQQIERAEQANELPVKLKFKLPSRRAVETM